MPDDRRFTLGGILCVILMLSVVAAIAVPALVRSRIASNETSAVAALKQIVSTQSTWRQCDLDRNGQQDYWTLDVAGFYGMLAPEGVPLALISRDFAAADASRRVSYVGKPSPNAEQCRPAPKSGYLFHAMTDVMLHRARTRLTFLDSGCLRSDATRRVSYAGPPTTNGGRAVPLAKTGYKFQAIFDDPSSNALAPYNCNYVPTQRDPSVLRNSKGAAGYATACNSYLFGFCAAPATYSRTGTRSFIVNEEGVIHGLDRGNNAFIMTWPGTDPAARTRPPDGPENPWSPK